MAQDKALIALDRIAQDEAWRSAFIRQLIAFEGAIDAPGMEGLSPVTGLLTFNPTRARGEGADDMLITGAGLWIASDNQNDSVQCGGKINHAGICLLPYA